MPLRIRDYVLRIFDIRVGEFRRVWLMQLHIFLLLQCLWIIKPVVNAQFLSRAGIEKLPLVFLLVAITALLVTTLYSRLQNRLSLKLIIPRTYLLSMFALLSFGILLKFQLFEDWMSYVFYIGVALFGLITTSQFWLMGNLVFTSLEAKRLFGFIGAGAIAGGISGGYLTSLLAPVLDSTNLLFVAAALLLITMGVNKYIWLNYIPQINPALFGKQKISPAEFPFQLVRNSKLLTHLALIMGLSVVVAKLVEFQFSAIASERFKDPDQLTAFFGFWVSTSNVVSLGIQLLVTQWVVRMLGVGRSLLVLPGALFAGASLVLNSPVLWAGTTLKLLDISLKQSVNKAATELLIMPIPMAIKNRVKTFIDVFVDTTATGIGGIILIFLINGLDLSVKAVCIIILALICIWIYLAVRARNEYSIVFMEKLHLTRTPNLRKNRTLSDAAVTESIKRTLNAGSIKQILFLLARIEENKDHMLMADVIPLLKHESPAVRQAALRCLYYYNDHSIIEIIEPLLKDVSDEVRARAFSCLLAHTRQNRLSFIEDYLMASDPIIRGAALVGLATEARNNPKLLELFKLEDNILELIRQAEESEDVMWIESSKILAARAIGYGNLESKNTLLQIFLKDSNPAVVKQAILAAGSTGDLNLVKIILNFLANKTTRRAAQKSLARFPASELIPVLNEYRLQQNLPHEVLIQLPSLAERMNTPQAVNFLFNFFPNNDHTVKQNALETLLTIKSKFSYLKISQTRMLLLLTQEADAYKVNQPHLYSAKLHAKQTGDNVELWSARNKYARALEIKSDHVLKRIFLELALLYSPTIILPLYEDLYHKDVNIRMNAVELLDNILDPVTKLIVLPVLESVIAEINTHDGLGSLDMDVPTEFASCKSVLKSEDDKLKVLVLLLIDTLNDPEFDVLLKLAAADDNPTVKILAEKILQKE
ncbi:MAG: HEAT repeat domain-containing protein [Saprospiraceae bacterium]|nr:HEAT repeat domain-containing protein [Saprospiraceae bacterium]